MDITQCISAFIFVWAFILLCKKFKKFVEGYDLGESALQDSFLTLVQILLVVSLSQLNYIYFLDVDIQSRYLSIAIALTLETVIIGGSKITTYSLYRWLIPILHRQNLLNWINDDQPIQIPKLCQQCHNCSFNPYLLCAVNPEGPLDNICYAFERLDHSKTTANRSGSLK